MESVEQSHSHEHPGVYLKSQLKERGISQKDFASALGIRQSRLSEMLNGHRNISIDCAAKIEDCLDISAKMLLDMQLSHKLLTKINSTQKPEDASLIFLANIDKIICVKSLLKGTSYARKSPNEKINYITNIYGFNTVEQLQQKITLMWKSCFRKSAKTGIDERMIRTWVLMANSAASKRLPEKQFNYGCENQLCTQTVKLLHQNIDAERRLIELFNDYGICLVKVEKIDKASIDGYSFFINETPCIAITSRFNRIDNLAFTIMHELGHLFLRHTNKDTSNLNFDPREYQEEWPTKNECELRADRYASNALIPDNIWSMAPVVPMNPFIIQRKYSEWAEKRNLNKWIVLGRLSHETGMYKFTSDNTRKINTLKEGGKMKS